jgi:hypothetical protein
MTPWLPSTREFLVLEAPQRIPALLDLACRLAEIPRAGGRPRGARRIQLLAQRRRRPLSRRAGTN